MRTDLDNDDADHARQGERVPDAGPQPRERGGARGATQASNDARGRQVVGYARDGGQQGDEEALGYHEGVAQNTADPEVDAAHFHRLADGDRLRSNRREDAERDNEGIDEHTRQVNRTQGCLHLADPRRAVHVEGQAKASEETRKPVEDRGTRTDDENHATRRTHGLKPRDKEGRAEAKRVADKAPEPGTYRRPTANLPREGDHREQLHRQQRGRGARAHDKRVEDEEGQKFCTRIELARRLAWGVLGERDLRQRRPSRSACAARNDQ